MVGILPFLMQWLTLTKFAPQEQSRHPQQYSSPYYQTQPETNSFFTPKSHWTLINEFVELPEDEIETFLPQVLNIILDNEAPDQYGIYQHLERAIITKCAKSLPFGLKVSHLLKASSPGSSEGLFRSVLSPQSKDIKEAKLREFQAHVEAATYCGADPSERMRYLRSTYCQDYLFMLSSLARLGTELKHSPAENRNRNLRSALSQFNSLLFNRMLSKGKTIEQQQHLYPGLQSTPSAPVVSQLCPQAAAYSLHLPIQHSRENTLRILQFVENECEVLPSKERCPYLVVAELLEQPYNCNSPQLYCEGHLTADMISMGRDFHQHRICDDNSPPTVENADNVKLFAREGSTSNDSQDSSPGITSALTSTADYEILGENVNNPYSHNAHSWDEVGGNNVPFNTPSLDSVLPFTGRGGQYYDTNNYPAPATYYPGDTVTSQPLYYPESTAYPMQAPEAYPPQYAYANERKVFMKGRTWLEKKQMIQSMSAFGHLPGWTIRSFIVKSGDDLRKEVVAMQLIEFFRNIFHSEGLDISLRPYRIMSTGQQSGLVEFLEGTRSIDSIKKSCTTAATIKDYFEFCFGATYSPIHANAVQNFVKSLVGYSLVTYVLQVKDRHNANILIDSDGHVVHIDFGFILGDSPGFNINFENAPFKLTREYIEVLGGIDSVAYRQFEDLFVRGFFALQKHVDAICTIVQLFYGPRRKNAADALRSRLLFARGQDEVLALIRDSVDSWRTKQYDWFQQRTNNILM